MTTGVVDAGAVRSGSGTAAAGKDSIGQAVAYSVAIGCIGSGLPGRDSWPGTATVVVLA